jgi:Uncharacterised MFS-type transporter YbfB
MARIMRRLWANPDTGLLAIVLSYTCESSSDSWVVASAGIFILGSSIVIERVQGSEYSHLGILIYSGIGAGIALTGLIPLSFLIILMFRKLGLCPASLPDGHPDAFSCLYIGGLICLIHQN